MRVKATIKSRSMPCVRVTIDVTPEEAKSLVSNLRQIDQKGSVSLNVITWAFLELFEAASKPTVAS